MVKEIVKNIVTGFVAYQIQWLTSHNDIEFTPEEEALIVQFLKDTGECFLLEANDSIDAITKERKK